MEASRPQAFGGSVLFSPAGGDSMAAGWRKVDSNVEFDGEGFIAQVIAVEQEGEERPFVSLDDLERWSAEDPSKLPDVLKMLRTVYDSWQDRTGGVYINKATLESPEVESLR
jgi:hypothetical protein